jgi:hypothetical protein
MLAAPTPIRTGTCIHNWSVSLTKWLSAKRQLKSHKDGLLMSKPSARGRWNSYAEPRQTHCPWSVVGITTQRSTNHLGKDVHLLERMRVSIWISKFWMRVFAYWPIEYLCENGKQTNSWPIFWSSAAAGSRFLSHQIKILDQYSCRVTFKNIHFNQEYWLFVYV